MMITSSLTSVLAEIIVGPVTPFLTIVPVETTTVTGTSTLSVYTVAPTTTSVDGSSTSSSTTITPSKAEVIGVATLSVFSISPSSTSVSGLETEPITPTTEIVEPSTQAVSPNTLQINPLTGNAKITPDINTSPQITIPITPITGTARAARTTQSVIPTTFINTPIVGMVTVTPTSTRPAPPPPPPPNQPPVAYFIHKPSYPVVGEEVTFDASDSYDPDGGIVSYKWDLGDGNVISTTANFIKHAFATEGSFTVILTVEDDDGATDSLSRVLDVAIPTQPPIAVLSHYPKQPKAGEWVTLDASSSYDPDGEIEFYTWDLEDDGIYDYSTSQPIIKVLWDNSGKYEVRLMVIDNRGATDTTVEVIDVSPSFTEKVNNIRGLLPWNKGKITLDELPIIKQELDIHNFPNDAYGDWVAMDEEDELIREKLYWYGDTDLLSALNMEINSAELSDMTYGTYILNFVYEEKEIEYVLRQDFKRASDTFWYTYSRINKGWGWLALDLTIKILIGLLPNPIYRTAIGLLYMSVKASQGLIGLKQLRDTYYYKDMWIYFDRRKGGLTHEEAWSEPGLHLFVKNNPDTEKTFEHLWETYGAYFSGAELKKEFKDEVRKNFRKILLEAVHKSKTPDRIIISGFSPAEFRIYDPEGNVTGLVKGQIREEIPYSAYDNETKTAIMFFQNDPNHYTFEVLGAGDGSYGLRIVTIIQGEINTFVATGIPTSINEIHQYSINWTALSLGEEGVTVLVDSDGDGVFEHTFTSDSMLTHDEFVLQTKTVIDIDPDALNLKGEGRWITAYIEFPEGYDVADINVSSIMLNGTIPVDPSAPCEIGDYDSDGVTDLMVKFNRTQIIDYILANVDMVQLMEQGFMTVTLTVKGKLNDGTPFQASCTIKVIWNPPKR